MKIGKGWTTRAGRCLGGTVICTLLAMPAWSQDDNAAATEATNNNGRGNIPQVVVTAQKTEQALEKVPIAITALDATALDAQQIETFSDLQFNVPNVSFSKTNFTSSNFQIRGIGNTLIAASSDQGVGIHVNGVPLVAPRIFEIDYFDVQRIEILRGPQGTLQGRNSTSGTVNMITQKPTDEFEGYGEFEYGNYDSKRGEAAINIPFGNEVGALRLAGIWVNRDGYTRNLYDIDTQTLDLNGKGHPVDGRDSYALRGSLRLNPSDTTEINLMVSYFKEDSDRTRSQKQLCHKDPIGNYGCLPDSLEFETFNSFATIAGILPSELVLGPLGLYPTGTDLNANSVNPHDLRKIAQDFDPIYKADELLITFELEQELTDSLTLSVVGGYQDTKVFSQSDYNVDIGANLNVPFALPFALPVTYGAYFSNGTFPISMITPGNSGTIGFNILNSSTTSQAYDQSNENADQFSIEVRLRSSFDGPVNFLVGGFYLDHNYESDYYVVASALDYFALVGGGALTGIDGVGIPAPYFNSETDSYGLESFAVFGELYWDITDAVRLTGGVRYTEDQKTIRDRQLLYDALTTGGFVPFGTDPIPDAALNPYREDTTKFKKPTWRVVLEWSPELESTDSTLVYFSYSRGYKGGGFNPPFDPALFPGTTPTFKPESIDAFEIGTKNRLADNTVSANLTGFYYDYKGLQVSRIQNRTSFNENIDAKVWGAEAELIWAPNQNWLFNVNASYLGSSIADNVNLINTRDPSAGRNGVDATLIKDATNGSNCLLEWNGGPDPIAAGILQGPFADCATLEQALQAGLGPNSPYTVDADGQEVNLGGNELQQAPDFTINIGAQYTHYFSNGMNLTLRVDYYYQTSMWGRIFNDNADHIANFDLWNAALTLNSADDSWYIKAFIQNIENDDAIIGMYVTDASSGLWTNVFTTEPRRWGLVAGMHF